MDPPVPSEVDLTDYIFNAINVHDPESCENCSFTLVAFSVKSRICADINIAIKLLFYVTLVSAVYVQLFEIAFN